MNTARIARGSLVLPVLVFTVAFVAFLPGLKGQLLDWDDGSTFLKNPNFRASAGATSAGCSRRR